MPYARHVLVWLPGRIARVCHGRGEWRSELCEGREEWDRVGL
jgi:hypothetical protein